MPDPAAEFAGRVRLVLVLIFVAGAIALGGFTVFQWVHARGAHV